MSSIIGAALRMALGVARSSVSENLKDGDLNSQQLRNLILSDIECIKTKLDALARRELMSSAKFIEEGLFTLNDLLFRERREEKLGCARDVQFQKSSASVVPKFNDLFKRVVHLKTWLKRSEKEADTSMVNTDYYNLSNSAGKLIHAVSVMKSQSPDLFKSAMESFKNAHTRATDEFFNESLVLADRILAAKLRVQSRLLLSIETLTLANACKLYLKDLHDLPQIVEIFHYDLDRGVMSNFNKAERHELVHSVSMINFVVFTFMKSFTKELVNVYNWPQIGNETWIYNPLIPDELVFKELQLAKIQVPNLVSLEQVEITDPKLVAINSVGELIVFRQRTNPEICELLKISRNVVDVFYTFSEFTLVSYLAINDADFVYVFSDNVHCGAPSGYAMYDVFVFYPDGNLVEVFKHFVLLEGSIVLSPTPQESKIAICMPDEILHMEWPKIQEEEATNEKGENIQTAMEFCSKEIILGEINIGDGIKYPGEMNDEEKEPITNFQREQEIRGAKNALEEASVQEVANVESAKEIREAKLRSKMLEIILVEIQMSNPTLATITDKHNVFAIGQFGYRVRCFEKDSRFVGEFKLHGGARESCLGITFNNLTKELVVVSRVGNEYFLSTYLPKSNERRHYVRLANIAEDCQEINLTSHCCGSMAVITKKHVLFLQ